MADRKAVTPETPLDKTPDMWKVRDFCGWFRVSPNTAYAAVKAGTIPSVRIAGQIRIPRDKLVALIQRELEAAAR